MVELNTDFLKRYRAGTETIAKNTQRRQGIKDVLGGMQSIMQVSTTLQTQKAEAEKTAIQAEELAIKKEAMKTNRVKVMKDLGFTPYTLNAVTKEQITDIDTNILFEGNIQWKKDPYDIVFLKKKYSDYKNSPEDWKEITFEEAIKQPILTEGYGGDGKMHYFRELTDAEKTDTALSPGEKGTEKRFVIDRFNASMGLVRDEYGKTKRDMDLYDIDAARAIYKQNKEYIDSFYPEDYVLSVLYTEPEERERAEIESQMEVLNRKYKNDNEKFLQEVNKLLTGTKYTIQDFIE